jgi:hypothetical protein
LALKQFYIKNVGPAKIQSMSSKMKTNFKKSDVAMLKSVYFDNELNIAVPWKADK